MAAAAEAKKSGAAEPPKPLPAKQEPQRPVMPDSDPHVPTVLSNGMVAPIIPYAIKGAIWYQGESNAGKPENIRRSSPR